MYNKVDELRNLLRARDIALAEQRARHVKESVVFREQRHALAVNDPAFSGKIAKLFGWTDVVGSQTNNSPLFVSPELSRTGSPINYPTSSPTATCPTGREDRRDDGAIRVFTGGCSENNLADVVSDDTTRMSNSLIAVDSPHIAVLADGPDRNSRKDYQEHTSPSCRTTAVAPALLIVNPSNNEETTIKGCPQCTQLTHELEMALTDRTLAEAELVSMRKTFSLGGPGWEFESAGGAASQHARDKRLSVEPGVRESEDDDAEKTAPLSSSGATDNDFDLRDEVGRLEKLVSLGEEPHIDEKVVDHVELPMLEVRHRFPWRHELEFK